MKIDFEKLAEIERKKSKIFDLLMNASDNLVMQFFDIESEKMLDLKINVLQRLCNGESANSIGEDYYKILEKYEGGVWD